MIEDKLDLTDSKPVEVFTGVYLCDQSHSWPDFCLSGRRWTWWLSMTHPQALLHHRWRCGAPAERVSGTGALWQEGGASEQPLVCFCMWGESAPLGHLCDSPWYCSFITLLHACSFSSMSPFYWLVTGRKLLLEFPVLTVTSALDHHSVCVTLASCSPPGACLSHSSVPL